MNAELPLSPHRNVKQRKASTVEQIAMAKLLEAHCKKLGNNLCQYEDGWGAQRIVEAANDPAEEKRTGMKLTVNAEKRMREVLGYGYLRAPPDAATPVGRVNAMESRVADLEGRIHALEAQVGDLLTRLGG